MSTVVCGRHTLTFHGALGARIARAAPRTTAEGPIGAPREVGLLPPFLMGRQDAVALAHAAIGDRRPVNFHADCGYGKTTLLRHIVALGAEHDPSVAHAYLKLGGFGAADLLQRLVTELYTVEGAVRLTAQECAQVLGGATAIVALDDVALTQGQLEYLRRIMPGCGLVLGSAEPVLADGGAVHDLAGLARSAGVSLLSRELGRLIPEGELDAARELVAAIGGQPLRIRQAAALVRSGEHSLATLAAVATRDPGELDRLSVDALTVDERRVLAVTAFLAGALIPPDLAGVMAGIAFAGEKLEGLFHKGLVEHPDDRFGLPVCKGGTYRQLLFQYFSLGSSVRGLTEWLASPELRGEEAHSALEAVVGLLGYAAGRREWQAVIQVVRAGEPVLFAQGYWDTWANALDQGVEAARQLGDTVSESYFLHQKGTLAYFEDNSGRARELLEEALEIRVRLADEDGADRTRENLAFVTPGGPSSRSSRRGEPPTPPRDWRRIRRAAVYAAVGVVTLLLGALLLGGLPGAEDTAKSTPGGQDKSGSAAPGGTGSGDKGTDGGRKPAEQQGAEQQR
ncbi:ATP-binding protein, partial [Streptomyces sp. URMC 123]|uniref:ATP-binding protein n=1 Tax=Streptomyces sp. URMC 123 TaxID=3423403 RepID=UPI003F1A866A